MKHRKCWYLAFVGTQTIPLRAVSLKDAREQVRAFYAKRGLRPRERELRVRRASAKDVGWLEDAGADRKLVDELRASTF